MSWVKLDDQIFGHPKILRAGKDARDVFLVALTYCASQLTDGFIPEGALPMIGAQAIVDSIKDCTERLVSVNLWEAVPGGYLVHDYLDYQPSGEQKRHERQQNAKRQATYKERHKGESKPQKKSSRKASGNAVTNAVTNGVTNGRVTPAPYPYPFKGDPISGSDPNGKVDLSPEHARPAIASARSRPRDELWEALVDVMGCQPETDVERKRWNTALAQIRRANPPGTPEEIRLRAARLVLKMERKRLTPFSLASNWGELSRDMPPDGGSQNGTPIQRPAQSAEEVAAKEAAAAERTREGRRFATELVRKLAGGDAAS